MTQTTINQVIFEDRIAVVEYKSGRVKTYDIKELPKTVQQFCYKAKLVKMNEQGSHVRYTK